MTLLRIAPRFLAVLGGLLLAITSHANVITPVSWSISGAGTTSAVANSPTDWDLNYSVNRTLAGLGFAEQTWTVSAVAPESGKYAFLWDYSGFHAFFQVTAFLESSTGETLVDTGPANCCTSPSAGFHYSGLFAFTDVTAGDTIGFSMGGDNFDSDNRLIGTLNLVQVPEPGTLALLALGFLGLGFNRMRRAA